LWAKHCGGDFLLRFEDTDRERSSAEFEEAILNDLKWLGIEPDGAISRQTSRFARYREILGELIKLGAAFPCFCSHEDEAHETKRPYADPCRHITREEGSRRIDSGEPFCVRFASPLEGDTVVFSDRLHGELSFSATTIGDFVLMRSDDAPTYLFAVVVDDHDFQITHVIRGEEHISNTPKQELIYRALGWRAPEWIHIPMVLDTQRHKLSKRSGAVSIASYREDGWTADALVSYMATLSWSGAPADRLSTAIELAGKFDIDSVALVSPAHDTERMRHFGRMAMRKIGAATLLRECDLQFPRIEDPSDQFDLDRTNLVGELLPQCACRKDLEIAVSEVFECHDSHERLDFADIAWMRELCKKLSSLSQGEWCSGALKVLLKDFQKERELKGKMMYHVLRAVLSGKESGVPLSLLMGCLGKKNALKRLEFALIPI
jgi:nondiscriminating glutamyl-tRNA synthetase